MGLYGSPELHPKLDIPGGTPPGPGPDRRAQGAPLWIKRILRLVALVIGLLVGGFGVLALLAAAAIATGAAEVDDQGAAPALDLVVGLLATAGGGWLLRWALAEPLARGLALLLARAGAAIAGVALLAYGLFLAVVVLSTAALLSLVPEATGGALGALMLGVGSIVAGAVLLRWALRSRPARPSA